MRLEKEITPRNGIKCLRKIQYGPYPSDCLNYRRKDRNNFPNSLNEYIINPDL